MAPSLPGSGHGQLLPALERLAPPPQSEVIGAEIEARTAHGDVVLELNGRGAWVARSAVNRRRRAFVLESAALTRLVAELVLRPPDLRHLDAAITALAIHPRGEQGLRDSIAAGFASRCAVCGEPVRVDEFIWEAGATAPARRSYRCAHCRDGRAGDGRLVPVDDDDLERAASLDAAPARTALRARFPVPVEGSALPEQLLDLFTPRALDALHAILERIESELRAPAIQAALRLALVHVLLPSSRLNAYPGRLGSLRVSAGVIRSSIPQQSRERNPWLLFEEGCRLVRAFIQRIDGVPGGAVPARLGSDLAALREGSANVVVAVSDAREPPGSRAGPVARSRVRPGDGDRLVRLVLAMPPVHWTAENLGFGYLASSMALGHDAAGALPLDQLFGDSSRGDWAWDGAPLERELTGVRRMVAPDGVVVVPLDRSRPGSVVASVLGAVGAGFRIRNATLAPDGDGLTGSLELVRRRAAPSPTPIDPNDEPERLDERAVMSAIASAVAEIAVAVLRARGEPAGSERMLVEVLIGLDRMGHLERVIELARQADWEAAEANQAAAPSSTDRPARSVDPVKLTLDVIAGELGRPDHPDLVELEPGRWWLRDADSGDMGQPLADRVEWAAFSLLSTSDGIREDAFLRGIGRMFRGLDTPDEALVRACLDSYRSDRPASDGMVSTADALLDRYQEHGTLTGMLAEIGHGLGLQVWISEHEQRRGYRGRPLAELLSEGERRAYLPHVCPGPADALEAVDVIWYLRGRLCFLFEVEWTAMLGEPVLQRGPRIPTSDSVVRFLVIPRERVDLVRFKLDRSPILRARMEQDNWHVLRADHVRLLYDQEEVSLDDLSPLLGLDPELDRHGEQLALFAG
jgi:hypothetical protein